ncbi:MAG: hypothetical protein E7035_07860 [Verrucomicrobiaceae bacterium]|nr:hypothetical protein [Verrucomicrobiaceae bacterium]
MIISTIVASAALMSPVDVAENISQPTEPIVSNAPVSKLEEETKMGASVNYTYSFVGNGSQSMDDARSWD